MEAQTLTDTSACSGVNSSHSHDGKRRGGFQSPAGAVLAQDGEASGLAPEGLHITEHAYIWVNLPKDDITPDKQSAVKHAIQKWKQTAEDDDDTATLRLVNRRLAATSQDDDMSTGHFPIHLGQLTVVRNPISVFSLERATSPFRVRSQIAR